MRIETGLIWGLLAACTVTMVIFGIWPGIDLAVSGAFHSADGFAVKQTGAVEAVRNVIWDATLVVPLVALMLLPLVWGLKRSLLLTARGWGFVLALFLIGGVLKGRASPAGGSLIRAGAILAVSLAIRTIDIELCRWTNVGGRPLGLHFMWHLLNAWALYVLIVAAVRHTAAEVPRSPGLHGDPVP